LKEYFSQSGIYYRINGFIPGRPTLVFIHGLSGSSSAWFEYEKKFESKYNIFTLDLRGHGVSIRPKSYNDYEIKKFADDISEIIAQLRIERFVLVSHSFGALIALELLEKEKEKIVSTVFLSPIFDAPRVARLGLLLLSLGALCIKMFPSVPRHGGHVDYSKFAPYTGDWDAKRLFADIHNTSLRVYLYCLRRIYEFKGENRVYSLNLPILIMHGKKDTFMPVAHSISLAARLKRCKLILLDNANHIIVLNNIPEVARAIENFVGV